MLTNCQSAILAFIREFTAANGEPPTVDEIEAHFEWISPETANDWVQSALGSFLDRMMAWQIVRRPNAN